LQRNKNKKLEIERGGSYYIIYNGKEVRVKLKTGEKRDR
jgi:hypothetical protein